MRRPSWRRFPLNGARVSAVEVGGPYAQATGRSRASTERIYTCGHVDGGHVPGVHAPASSPISRGARSGARCGAREAAKYVALARGAEKDEGSFEEGLAVGLQALLVSPDFLFRIERPTATKHTGATQPITQHQLATRLSYFLWASMPDAALRSAADAGTLRDPAVLAAQVRRMLRDPRSHALAEQFGGQWLQFRALESTTRNRERFPEFEDYLRLSMRRETELFVEHIVREDRSILDFLDAQLFVHERAAGAALRHRAASPAPSSAASISPARRAAAC